MDLSVCNTEKRQILSDCVAALRIELENSTSKRTPRAKKANRDSSTPAAPSKRNQQAHGKGGSVCKRLGIYRKLGTRVDQRTNPSATYIGLA
jgi:hypothetical protein